MTAFLAVIGAGGCGSSHTSTSGFAGGTQAGAGGRGGAGIAGGGGGGGEGGGGGGQAATGGAAPGGSGGIACWGGAGGDPGGFAGNVGIAGAPGPDCSPLFTSGETIVGSQKIDPQILLANLTGHGKRDLIVATSSELLTFVNDGAGHFALAAAQGASSRFGFDVTAGDLNGDGIDDVAYVGVPLGQIPVGPPVLNVFSSAGDGTLAASTYTLPEAGQSVVIGDLDGDRLADVLISGTTTTFVLPNAGAGKLGPPAGVSVDRGRLTLADMDGDGRPDVIVNAPSGLEVSLNQGGLVFSPPRVVGLGGALGFSVEQLIPVDANGDQAIDIVVLGRVPMIDQARRTVVVGLNDGQGTLVPGYTAKVSQDNGALAAGDFDADGRPDIAVSAASNPSLGNGQLDYFLATPGGSYAASSCRTIVSSAASTTGTLVAGDVNGDGRTDLLIVRDDGVGVLLDAAP